MIYKFFDKTSTDSCVNFMPNQQLDLQVHKRIIRKFKRRRVYSSFRDNICAADLADMQLISKYYKGSRYLLCAIDGFSKYEWAVPIKYKKGVIIDNAFQGILDSSKRKPNKI